MTTGASRSALTSRSRHRFPARHGRLSRLAPEASPHPTEKGAKAPEIVPPRRPSAWKGVADLALGVSVTKHSFHHVQVMAMLGFRLGLCFGPRDAIGQGARDGADQMSHTERLENVRHRPCRDRTFDNASRAVPGESNDRDVALVQDPACRFYPIHSRQAQIDQNQIWSMLAGELDCLDAVPCFRADIESCVFENESQVGANDRIVFDRQNAC